MDCVETTKLRMAKVTRVRQIVWLRDQSAKCQGITMLWCMWIGLALDGSMVISVSLFVPTILECFVVLNVYNADISTILI